MQRVVLLAELLTDERAARSAAEYELAKAQAKLAEWDALFAPKRAPRGRRDTT